MPRFSTFQDSSTSPNCLSSFSITGSAAAMFPAATAASAAACSLFMDSAVPRGTLSTTTSSPSYLGSVNVRTLPVPGASNPICPPQR